MWDDVYESGARAGSDALLGELGLDLSVREKGVDVAQALVRKLAKAFLDGPFKADFALTSPIAIAKHVAVGHAHAVDKAVATARVELARTAVALRVAERELDELNALCEHADEYAGIVRKQCISGGGGGGGGRRNNNGKKNNKKQTGDGGGSSSGGGGTTTVSVSVIARQTDETERKMMDAIVKVKQALEHFERRYPTVQLHLPLPRPLGSGAGVAAVELRSSDSTGEATDNNFTNSSNKRRKTVNWSGKEGMVCSPAVRELLYHLTK